MGNTIRINATNQDSVYQAALNYVRDQFKGKDPSTNQRRADELMRYALQEIHNNLGPEGSVCIEIDLDTRQTRLIQVNRQVQTV